ncbi:hypothetical protein KY290_012264 [Solanum tuberosum]|uniref:Cytochrome b561 domain-containing protein n=1 Tax=Solanum tuberosum TaxID=4113 RepID=A0ABQ7W5K2_SOLTU|nr:hypothetical protein KY289_011571 [Solanum tuberosum]KAH0775127.1 hypothetical protein KY290_012264 [Solanum tuberosum]
MYLHENTRKLDIMVGAKLKEEEETGWLAWGLNPGPEARMVGTQALIATIILPMKYDLSRLNQVWQVGINIGAVGNKELKMHGKGLMNYDSSETINLRTGKGRGNRVHESSKIRQVHGILNIIGWGTVLPIGVIIARNFREFPLPWLGWKKYHISCQTIGYLVGTTGWAVGIWLGKASKYYSFPKHGTYGLFIFAFATIQMLFFKLKPGDRDEFRMYRNMFHHVVGYSLLIGRMSLSDVEVRSLFESWVTNRVLGPDSKSSPNFGVGSQFKCRCRIRVQKSSVDVRVGLRFGCQGQISGRVSSRGQVLGQGRISGRVKSKDTSSSSSANDLVKKCAAKVQSAQLVGIADPLGDPPFDHLYHLFAFAFSILEVGFRVRVEVRSQIEVGSCIKCRGRISIQNQIQSQILGSRVGVGAGIGSQLESDLGVKSWVESPESGLSLRSNIRVRSRIRYWGRKSRLWSSLKSGSSLRPQLDPGQGRVGSQVRVKSRIRVESIVKSGLGPRLGLKIMSRFGSGSGLVLDVLVKS